MGSVFLRPLRSARQAEAGEEAARRVAGEAGAEMSRAERRSGGIAPPGRERAMAATAHVLDETGYEPLQRRPLVFAWCGTAHSKHSQSRTVRTATALGGEGGKELGVALVAGG